MNREKFDVDVNAALDSCKHILITKGREYQSNNDERNTNVFANFERGANLTGVQRETVLFIYLSKHWDSICTFMKDLQSGKGVAEIESKMSEPINGRFMDAINYLLILNSRVNDKRFDEEINVNKK